MHRLNAVLGWLELGLPADGLDEFQRMPQDVQERPEMLDLRWTLEARLERWPEALATAEKLMAVQPGEPSSWLHHAYALRRVPHGGLAQAQSALRPAFEKFQKEATIPYNLACYACQLGNLEEARAWLARAVERSSPQHIRGMALKDNDLTPLWDEIARSK